MSQYLVWYFKNPNPDAALPNWAQDRDIFTGQYISPKNNTVAVIQSNLTQGHSGKVTNGFMKALCRAKMIHNGCDLDAYGSSQEYTIAEFTLSGNFEGMSVGIGDTIAVCYSKKKKIVYARDGNKEYSMKTSAPIFLCLWPLFMDDLLFSATFDVFCAADDEDDLKSAACLLADIAYQLCKDGRIVLPERVTILQPHRMQMPSVQPTDFYGHFQEYVVSSIQDFTIQTKQAYKHVPADQFNKSCTLPAVAYPPEIESRIPVLDDKHIVSAIEIEMCEDILASSKTPRPIRNALFRGPSGVGKTEATRAIAAGCGLPYFILGCHSAMEVFHLLGDFQPQDEEEGGLTPSAFLKHLPEPEEMVSEPIMAYQEITGAVKEDATSTDCLAACFKLAAEKMSKAERQHFKFVASPLIFAMQYGGVICVDEISLPRDPGVLPALNNLMDGIQSITLTNGKLLRRHPNALLLATSNVNYAGNNVINESFIDRCQLIFDLDDLTDEELEGRIKSMTGDDMINVSIVLTPYIEAYRRIRAFLEEIPNQKGEIGPRKLADWIGKSMRCNNPLMAASRTIIPGAGASKDIQLKVMETVSELFR